jgi:hypothetical protein
MLGPDQEQGIEQNTVGGMMHINIPSINHSSSSRSVQYKHSVNYSCAIVIVVPSVVPCFSANYSYYNNFAYAGVVTPICDCLILTGTFSNVHNSVIESHVCLLYFINSTYSSAGNCGFFSVLCSYSSFHNNHYAKAYYNGSTPTSPGLVGFADPGSCWWLHRLRSSGVCAVGRGGRRSCCPRCSTEVSPATVRESDLGPVRCCTELFRSQSRDFSVYIFVQKCAGRLADLCIFAQTQVHQFSGPHIFSRYCADRNSCFLACLRLCSRVQADNSIGEVSSGQLGSHTYSSEGGSSSGQFGSHTYTRMHRHVCALFGAPVRLVVSLLECLLFFCLVIGLGFSPTLLQPTYLLALPVLSGARV